MTHTHTAVSTITHNTNIMISQELESTPPPPTSYVIEFTLEESEDPQNYDPKWKAIDRFNIPSIVSEKMSPMAWENFCNDIDRALEPQSALTKKERMALKVFRYISFLWVVVYFALGYAGIFYIAPFHGDSLGNLIMDAMIVGPPVIIFIMMTIYFSGQRTNIEKSVEAILESENSKYIGSSSGIFFLLKERECPSQRRRDRSSNNDGDPTPITYMQHFIIVQDLVNYSPPEIV